MVDEPDSNTVQCSRCGGTDTRKHGQHLGKQRYYCKRCGRAFTGSEYRYHPGQDVTALKAENQRLQKVVEAAKRMDDALEKYLELRTGRAMRSLRERRERFAYLLAGVEIEESDLPDESEQSPKIEFAHSQHRLFDD